MVNQSLHGTNNIFAPSNHWLKTSIYMNKLYIKDLSVCFTKQSYLISSGSHLLSRAVSSKVPSAVRALTVVFGMGTGVSLGRIATRNFLLFGLFYAFRTNNKVKILLSSFHFFLLHNLIMKQPLLCGFSSPFSQVTYLSAFRS